MSSRHSFIARELPHGRNPGVLPPYTMDDGGLPHRRAATSAASDPLHDTRWTPARAEAVDVNRDPRCTDRTTPAWAGCTGAPSGRAGRFPADPQFARCSTQSRATYCTATMDARTGEQCLMVLAILPTPPGGLPQGRAAPDEVLDEAGVHRTTPAREGAISRAGSRWLPSSEDPRAGGLHVYGSCSVDLCSGGPR